MPAQARPFKQTIGHFLLSLSIPFPRLFPIKLLTLFPPSLPPSLPPSISPQTNPKYWDDEEASDVREAYGEDWEKIAAFTYDGVDYTMVKILEPVLVLAKEDPVRSRKGEKEG